MPLRNKESGRVRRLFGFEGVTKGKLLVGSAGWGYKPISSASPLMKSEQSLATRLY